MFEDISAQRNEAKPVFVHIGCCSTRMQFIGCDATAGVVQAFLDEKTKAKICLVYTDQELRAALLPHIQPAHLYENLGG